MKKVLLGMSGGVDSTVAAKVLLEEGYEVVGATIIFCGNSDENSVLDAKRVCEMLGIEHMVLDFIEEFRKYVIKDFIENYKKGKTPNPCIRCNKFMKFRKVFRCCK